MSNNLTDNLVQQFRKSFELSRFAAQLVSTANFIGYFCMAVPAALLMRRRGYKIGIVVAGDSDRRRGTVSACAWMGRADDREFCTGIYHSASGVRRGGGIWVCSAADPASTGEHRPECRGHHGRVRAGLLNKDHIGELRLSRTRRDFRKPDLIHHPGGKSLIVFGCFFRLLCDNNEVSVPFLHLGEIFLSMIGRTRVNHLSAVLSGTLNISGCPELSPLASPRLLPRADF